MISFLQLLFSILVIIIIVPQTRTTNLLVINLHETGIFTSYRETINFLKFISWFCIFSFIFLTFLVYFF
uniref:Hypothetical chloroplast RF47 n=1 Tax=Koliella corcontica TaxID=155904 RepID=A0A097KMY4_9CHLO|nr:hypothetical chloroplast RF47 [Koliella corcontica]AIT94535.1 hypothetical chloroplast RF47 [Koliella corcontica]